MSKLSAKEFLQAIRAEDFQRPWPIWAKRAGARFANILFPIFTTKQWLATFASEDFFTNLEPLLNGGWGEHPIVLRVQKHYQFR